MLDPELEEDCPGLRASPYAKKSERDPNYNCVAFAVGDTGQWWEDVRIKGYYWPPGIPGSDTLEGWAKVFEIHGYRETETNDCTLESEYEKIAIYGAPGDPAHVARQKASGMWVSKMGKGIDFEHTLEGLVGEFPGDVIKVMKRKCIDGRRVLE
jgi:hypothetical protein